MSQVPTDFKSATNLFHRDPSRSSQVFEEVPEEQVVDDPVGRPIPHTSAIKQATGEAVYVDDIPPIISEF